MEPLWRDETQERGEQVNGTLRSTLIVVLLAVWGTVRIVGWWKHIAVPATVDSLFVTLVGSMMALKTKDKKTKD